MTASLPPGAVPPGATRVLLEVVRRHEGGEPNTYGPLMDSLGFTSRGTLSFHLAALRRRGLVTWDQDRQGTIRPTVRVVAHGQQPEEAA